jgi:hypothetical protein
MSAIPACQLAGTVTCTAYSSSSRLMTESLQTSGTNRTRSLTKRLATVTALVVVIVAGTAGVMLAIARPRADRRWIPQHAVMAHADVRGDSAYIHRLRNFSYASEEQFTAAYEDRRYDLSTLESVWFIVTPFSKQWRGPAHTFVSFGFADSQYVAISVEARREPGEEYGPLTGLFRQFELIYVIGDERDLIGSRAVYGGYDVYVYPIRTTRERMRALLVEMLARSNALATQPEFYNTLTSNCTSNVVDHVNHLAPRAVPRGIKTILPGYADDVAYSLGLIDNTISLDQARQRYRVNDQARRFATDPDFSRRIRAN